MTSYSNRYMNDSKMNVQKIVTHAMCYYDVITGKILLTCFEDDAIFSTFSKIVYVYHPQEVVYRK